jgi:hypothetical protein
MNRVQSKRTRFVRDDLCAAVTPRTQSLHCASGSDFGARARYISGRDIGRIRFIKRLRLRCIFAHNFPPGFAFVHFAAAKVVSF